MYGTSMSPRQEIPIFAAQGISVTSARLVVGVQTYPIANITSISPHTVKASRAGLIFMAIILLLISVPLFSNGAVGIGLFMLLVAAAGVIGAVLRKDEHAVMIATSGMQVRAVTSKDQQLVSAVVAALNEAIAMR